jgi:hypothetical protein
MPIEIKELHIRVAVSTSQNGQSSEGPAVISSAAGIGGNDTKEALVAECVEQVLRILEHKMER